MRALLAVCLAVASNASAKSLESARPIEPVARPGAIRIGKPDLGARIDRMTVSLWVKESEIVASVGFDIAGADATMRDVTIPLQLPSGSKATAMEVEINGVRTHAFSMGAYEARTFYKETVARIVDPALLEKRGDKLALHVFPIVKDGKQHVDITLTMPLAASLVIEPTGHAIGQLDVTTEGVTTSFTKVARARTIALPAPHRGIAGEVVPTRPPVDGSTSLVAGRSEIGTAEIRFHGRSWTTRRIDKVIIRSRIKLAMPRLTYCYERELLRDHSLSGTVDVEFMIHDTGAVTVQGTTGTLTDETVTSCIAGVFSSLEYPENDDNIVVHYPLTFRSVD